MPQIIVTADEGASFGEGAVMFRERVNIADFESEHFGTQLVERLGWAVGDADEIERVVPGDQDAAENRFDVAADNGFQDAAAENEFEDAADNGFDAVAETEADRAGSPV